MLLYNFSASARSAIMSTIGSLNASYFANANGIAVEKIGRELRKEMDEVDEAIQHFASMRASAAKKQQDAIDAYEGEINIYFNESI